MASICWKEGLENIIQASTKVGCVENRSNSNIPTRTLILAEKKKNVRPVKPIDELLAIHRHCN